ncbi:heparinase II/III domain-containing protein [Hirschia litorea]|uniref:Heparinase II/III family protein n=1 Tax=Hirschia litorea TaxID=1199156 RepID=A0ABW2IPF5_9PROT
MISNFSYKSSWLKAGVTVLALGLSQACSETVQAAEKSDISTQSVSAFDAQMTALAASIDARMLTDVPVPVPADAGGGYTHEQHKQNGKTIYEAGMLYQHTGDEKYKNFARDILLDYAELYPTLGLHPEHKPSTAGQLFWQGLNEAVWLVYVIQGYETFRDDLSPQAREKIETGVLNPMADFLSIGSPQTFDRIHNHGTWAAAAVGMTGYVLGQQERVEKSLLGLSQDGEAGFLKQMDMLFSPDGYYAEGPYYQRYAMMPFVLFSQAIEKNEPERKIFEYRDGIVLKAIRATVQQSYAGKFFPINDAIREKGLNTVELKYGLAVAYDLTNDPTLLGAVQLQDGSVVPTPEGRKLLDDIAAGKAKPFEFKSLELRDGRNGDEGALMVLRSGPESDASAVVMKATTQGLGHGHFDKLGLLYYDNASEVVADYGAVRFLNVEAKFGGRYLPENDSYGKQTIAHNTLVVDEKSHYDGDWRESQKFSPDVLKFGNINGVQVAAAEVDTAYEGVNLQRVVAMVPREDGIAPYVIDILRGQSGDGHVYDLPVHYKGQLIETNFPLEHETTQMNVFGKANGYQHLWQRAVSPELEGQQDMSWLIGDKFYTMTFAVDGPYKAYLTELGANDPNHNFRKEQALILRTEADNAGFVSVYESHGRYDNDEEVTVFDGSSVEQISTDKLETATAYTVSMKNGDVVTIYLADDTQADQTHKISHKNKQVEWSGAVHVTQ